MKLFVTICCFFSVTAYSQVFYQIQDKHIQIALSADLDSNKLLIRKILNDTSSKNCTELSISGNVSTLPEMIYEMDWIKYLELNLEKPLVLEKQLSKFKNLRLLLIFSNIKKIDEELILPKIESFTCNNSALNEFPKAICNWTNLIDIDIQQGNFKTIPKKINQLVNLQTLTISDNKLEKLPDEIGGLLSLEVLNVCENKLKLIPNSICNLKKLQELAVAQNPELKIENEQIKCMQGLLAVKNVSPEE